MLRTDFTITTPMLLGGIAVLLLISLGASYQWGHSNGINEMKEKAVLAEQAWNKKLDETRSEYEASVQTIRDEYTRNVTALEKQVSSLRRNPKVITKYITKSDNFQLPSGFLAWHDKSARGENLEEIPASVLLTGDCKYSLKDASLVLAKNYTTCLDCQAKLTALQKIVKEFQEKQKGLRK